MMYLNFNILSMYDAGGFLNQARAGHRLVHAWFLEIDSVSDVCVCVCVCPPPRLLITSSMIWTPYDWLNNFYSFIWHP